MPAPRRRGHPAHDERGVALVLTLLVLLGVGGLLAAYLAMSTFEPQISRNLASASRARYLAEGGIQRAFNVLISTADANSSWSGLLAGATATSPWVAIAGLTNTPIGGAPNGGTVSVTIRNDNGVADTKLTGLSATTTPAMDTSPTMDNNKTVIVRSAGTFNGVTKTIEVVVQRAAVPPFAGAVNLPGSSVHAAINGATLDIDGRDYGCGSGGAACDLPSEWVPTANPLKYGMAVRPGAEGWTEAALTTQAMRDAVKGKSRTDPAGSYATGVETVAGDGSVTPDAVDRFVSLVANNPATAVFHSTPTCPVVVTGSVSGATNAASLSNGCAGTISVSLGSREDPRLVFVRGDLTLERGLKGAGILVVQDGALRNSADFEWDGVVVVAGQGTSLTLAGDGRTTIRGAVVASESNPGAGAALDLSMTGSLSSISIRSSKQNVQMAQAIRALHSVTNWREI